MESEVSHRVRVLLLDRHDRLLLFRAEDDDGAGFWFAVGGRIELGESVTAAAAREIVEETGLTGVILGPEVWRRRDQFSWRGVPQDARERWFLGRTEDDAVDTRGFTDEERHYVLEHHWTLEELNATDEALAPRDLADRLAELLHDGPPVVPVEIVE